MEFDSLICELDCCKLILENPVTLLCGNTLCKAHLEKFKDKFICYFCKKEHQVPEDGFVINKTTNKIINDYFRLNPLRKKIKESFEELSESIEEYEKIEPDGYVFDYFSDKRNKVDLHREELKKEIDQKSDEIIKMLFEKEEKCKSKLKHIEKTNLDDLKKHDLPSLKQKIRSIKLNEVEVNDLTSVLNENVNKVQNHK